MQRWDLLEVEMPRGTRDPVVLHSDEEARAVLLRLEPGQELGDHQVKERAWIWVLDGLVRIRAGGEETKAGPGTLLRFGQDERRSIASDDGARILMLLAPWPGIGHYRGDRQT